MPEHFYNQLNGKSAQENYRRIVMNRQKKNKGILLSFIEGMLQETVKTALNEIFDGFKS